MYTNLTKKAANTLTDCQKKCFAIIMKSDKENKKTNIPCKSLEMGLTPFFTTLTSLHSPNHQSKAAALCSSYDDSIFGHGQHTQTLKK